MEATCVEAAEGFLHRGPRSYHPERTRTYESACLLGRPAAPLRERHCHHPETLGQTADEVLESVFLLMRNSLSEFSEGASNTFRGARGKPLHGFGVSANPLASFRFDILRGFYSSERRLEES